MSPVSGERYSFNTQPPKGGWQEMFLSRDGRKRFNTQPPKGGWTREVLPVPMLPVFQHTAA